MQATKFYAKATNREGTPSQKFCFMTLTHRIFNENIYENIFSLKFDYECVRIRNLYDDGPRSRGNVSEGDRRRASQEMLSNRVSTHQGHFTDDEIQTDQNEDHLKTRFSS